MVAYISFGISVIHLIRFPMHLVVVNDDLFSAYISSHSTFFCLLMT